MIKKCVECGKEIDMDKEDWVWFSGTGVVCKRCFELKPRVQTPPMPSNQGMPYPPLAIKNKEVMR